MSLIVKKMILAVPAVLALAACGTSAAMPPRTVALIASAQSLSCRAYMSKTRPADDTTTVVHVRTQASVEVFTVAFYKTVDRAYYVRAGTGGQASVPYHVSGATPGRKVEVVITVVRRHSASRCSTSFTPQQPGSPSPSPSSPAPSPSSPAGCYPLDSEGNCYMPGEYCPNADHGMQGVAGNGEAIVCEDNNGWRWEPA